MTPDHILADVTQALPKWQLVADCYAGEHRIKQMGEIYLPNPSPAKEIDEIRSARYRDYTKRAVFYNATRKTAKALVGLAFAKYPLFDAPDSLASLKDDIDGAGTSLVQHARRAMTMLLLKGRGGLLADFPVSLGGSVAQTKALKPVIKLYEPEQIINWRTTTYNGHKKLSLVVIKESYLVKDDGFKAEYGEQLLVLRLNNGIATSQIYQKHSMQWVAGDELPIYDHAQRHFDTIPFSFIGADDNDESIDDAPLYDLALLNLAHYRDSADYQESNFIAGQPTLFVTGVTAEWYRDFLEPNGGIHLGSRVGQILGQGATAQLLQATPNSANFEAMLHKEKQMISIGARLIAVGAQNKTATQAGAEIAEQTSLLATLCNNLSDAYTQCMGYLSRFVGVQDKVTVTFNTNFMTNKMTSDERRQLIAEWQAGAISFGEMRDKLVEDEIATIENSDEARAQIGSELQGYELE